MYRLLEYLVSFLVRVSQSERALFFTIRQFKREIQHLLTVMLSFSMTDSESARAVARQGWIHEINGTVVDAFREDEASSLTPERACALLQQQTARSTASCVTHTTSSVKVDWEKKETALHLSNPPLSDYCRLHHSDNDFQYLAPLCDYLTSNPRWCIKEYLVVVTKLFWNLNPNL